MRKKLKIEILKFLSNRVGKKPEQIRPRLSEIRRENSGLTLNAAAQIYAQQHGTSIMAKLDDEDQHSLASVQTITQINSSKTIKIDKRTLNISNSPIHNLSFGDRTNISQSVITLDESLAKLFESVENSQKIPQENKEDYKSDIQSLASQIGKKNPSKQIIKAAWKSIQGLADIQGFTQLIMSIASLIQHFLK